MLFRVLNKIIFRLGDLILGSSICKNIARYSVYDSYTEAQLETLQRNKLKRVLEHAVTNSPHYNNPDIRKNEDPFRWIKQFPILKKEMLRGRETNFLTQAEGRCIPYVTSGSSGIATKVYVDLREQSIMRAILIHWWGWSGYYPGKRMLQTGITPNRGVLKRVKDWVTRTSYMPAFSLKEEEMLGYLKKFEGKKDVHCAGFASSLYELARVAEKHKLRVRFDGVISHGDKLFPHYQKKIEEVFETQVYENYGCNEGFMIAQKVDLPYFYIYTPNVYIELLDEAGNEVADGQIGRVIATKLDGYAMPLIRYETGDLAVKLPREKYPERRRFNFPLLERVVGRETDIVTTPEGYRLIVHTFTGIFEFYPEIRQFRVVQERIEEISIEYIKGVTFNPEVLGRIEQDFREKTQSRIVLKWEEVTFIPPTKSGKPQIIESRIKKADESC